jgi:hypothetical protein
MPIPPYLGREDDAEDRIRYQTVYATVAGSVAAPTAGLHFTPEILAKLPHAFVTLHVGPGTFLPVRGENLDEHRMHGENYDLGDDAAAAINAAQRVIAVGTTSLRVLESLPAGPVAAGAGRTDIFIRPGFAFQHAGACHGMPPAFPQHGLALPVGLVAVQLSCDADDAPGLEADAPDPAQPGIGGIGHAVDVGAAVLSRRLADGGGARGRLPRAGTARAGDGRRSI